ncbi:MAG: YbaN family protein [Candidatus Aminicenantes bacterium]|nr:YbaN family protein [Candidatus Aminicenantes bacterium]
MIKLIYIFLGVLLVALGFIGILVPGLPTTPFLLLASGCFLKSSQRLHSWLINQKLFGKYLKSFQETSSIPKGIKILSITMMWIMIFCSICFFIKSLLIKILLIICGITGSIVILSFRTLKKE